MSGQQASALPPAQLLQQTPTRGLVSTKQASGRANANGDGGEDWPPSHLPTSRTPVVGAANARHSFPRTASISRNGSGSGGSVVVVGGGGGGGVGGINRRNSSQFAILAESCLASDEEGEPESPVHNPAEPPVGATARTTAARVGPRRDSRRGRSPEHSAGRASSFSNGRGGGPTAPPPPPPASFSTTVTGALARNFSMKNRRAQEDTGPKRRSKPRPGRGKSPHVEAAGAEVVEAAAAAGEAPLGLGAVLSNPLSETTPEAV